MNTNDKYVGTEDTENKLDLMERNRAIHPLTGQYAFCSSTLKNNLYFTNHILQLQCNIWEISNRTVTRKPPKFGIVKTLKIKEQWTNPKK